MALNHYPQEEHRHRFLAKQYCCSKQPEGVLCSEVASDAGRCMLMVGRSGDVRGITRPHWVVLYGLLGNTRMTPYAQKQREAARQAGVGRHGAGWPLLAASAHSHRLSE